MEESETELKRIPEEGRSPLDSRRTTEWREYLNGKKLVKAWGPIKGSPFKQFMIATTLEEIRKYPGLQPEFTRYMARSAAGIRVLKEELKKFGVLWENTAVVLDGVGQYSVAMAETLVEMGRQPVVMFNRKTYSSSTFDVQDTLAALLYSAGRIERLKKRLTPLSPPVFILDALRNAFPLPNKVDDSYPLNERNFPDAETLKQLGITTVVYVNMANRKGKIDPSWSPNNVEKDLIQVFRTWENEGITIFSTGVSPWGNEPLGIRPWPFVRERGASYGSITFNPLRDFSSRKKNR